MSIGSRAVDVDGVWVGGVLVGWRGAGVDDAMASSASVGDGGGVLEVEFGVKLGVAALSAEPLQVEEQPAISVHMPARSTMRFSLLNLSSCRDWSSGTC